jgi:hypothetical protein
MPRDARSRQQDFPSVVPAVAPLVRLGDLPTASSNFATVALGSAVVEIDVKVGQTVGIRTVRGDTALSVVASASDVSRWCAETSALIDFTVGVAAGDESQVRGPMLVADSLECAALVKRMTVSGSEFRIILARSPTDMAAGSLVTSLAAGGDDVRAFVAALRGAASAAMSSRET